jgi:hypothetical protein
MKVCVIIINDGRNDYLQRTLESFCDNVIFPEGCDVYKLLIDDVPAARTGTQLQRLIYFYKIDKCILNDENTGISATVQKAWENVPEDCDYIWHQENDFIFTDKVYIEKFAAVLESPIIYQVACLRQAWSEHEKQYGGIYQSAPNLFKDARFNDLDIVIHKEYFTHNPSLYRRDVIAQIPNYTEYSFKEYLMRKRAGYFAYWGKLTDKNLVEHIGYTKRGVGQI